MEPPKLGLRMGPNILGSKLHMSNQDSQLRCFRFTKNALVSNGGG
jgi:hypothetical protein